MEAKLLYNANDRGGAFRRPSRVLMAASASLSVFAAPQVFAQDEVRAASSDNIAEIVVTARRREESQQSVPVTITAISSDDIMRKGLTSTEDLRLAVPGVNISGQRRDDAQFSIRGQGPGPLTTGQRNFTSVATYFAEVPTTVAGPGVFYDISSVQVLKGPQGTLFGRNTTGGAVLFEPKAPQYENRGYVRLKVGNHDYKEFEGVVNVEPVPDRVAVRLAGQVSRRDGYTKSIVTNQEMDQRNYEAFRASIRLNPTDTFETTTIFDYRRKHGNTGSAIISAIGLESVLAAVPIPALPPGLNAAAGIPAGVTIPARFGGAVSIACLRVAIPGCPTGPFGNAIAAFQAGYNGGDTASSSNSGFALFGTTANAGLAAALAQQQALGTRLSIVDTVHRSKSLDWGITNRTSIDVTDNLTLKNIIAFRKSLKNEGYDYDGTPFPIISQEYNHDQWGIGLEQFTNEIQLQGSLPQANISYILGGYHEQVKTGFPQKIQIIALGSYGARVSQLDDKSDALFAHAEWNPNNWFGLSGGFRYTWDKRFVSYGVFTADGACNQADPVTGEITCPLLGDAKFDAPTYDVTVNLTPTDNVLIYGSFRHGYKSGGINLPAPIAPAPLSPDAYQQFGPEKVDSFEIGLKADWNFGVPLRTNIALFRDEYSNLQVIQAVPTVDASGNPSAPANIVRNGVKGVNKGVEVEAQIKPINEFALGGFFSYTDSVPTTSIPGAVTAGRQAGNQPKWKYGINGVLTLPAPNGGGTIAASAAWSWQSSAFSSSQPSLRSVNPSYGLLNARIDWNDAFSSGLDVSVFGTNILQKSYVMGGYPISQLGFDSIVYGEPRMFGMSLTYHFGDSPD